VASWQELFKTRWEWALRVVEDCRQMAAAAEDRYSEMDVMFRCLDAAVTNLESVIKGLEPKYADLQKWLPEAQADYSALTARWEQYLSLARSISVAPAMVRFMTGRDVGDAKGRPQRQATLEDLVDLETARKAGRLAPTSLRKFNNRIADLEKAAARLFQDAEDLFREYERAVERSAMSHSGEPQQLIHDIEALAKKINTDYQTALEYKSPSRDAILQASKIAANHTERLLPSMSNRALEMDEMLRYATQARNSLAAESVEFMRSITDITALSHTVRSQVSAVNQGDEFATFDYLRLIQQVPYMYASFVAEAIKRREWFDKMKQDSSTLANEMALFQEEEIKRRRRWYKSIGNAYGPESAGSDSNVPGLEVNLLGEDERWPAMTRRDLEDLQVLLQTNKADPQVVEDISKLVSEIDAPTRQQSKRMKAFKNGSVHEAALGRSGLLIRGDDELLRSLQDDKVKLESKLKTAESRVRRLEDLLHRQAEASRPSLGNLFQVPSQQLSGRADSTISVRSPQAPEDRRRSVEGIDVLAQRVQQLEAELSAEKERSAALERGLDGQVTLHDDMKSQRDEANSTKKDLLENLEALKREFMEERKSLESEIKRLQARLEDTEDEIEHFGESRENEKASYDETIQALRTEVDRLTREKRDETLKSEGKINFLREETRLQRETMEAQERQLQAAQDEAKDIGRKLEALNETADMQLKALQVLWNQLSPDEAVPGDLCDLVDGISVKAGDAMARLQGLESDMALLRLELDSAHNAATSTKAEQVALVERLSEEEAASTRLRETLAEEKAKVLALEGELADGREQLSQLRAKIADGETGSESMRKRLEEEEKKITMVTEELASRQSQVGSLEEEVRHFKDKLQRSQSKLSDLTVLFDTRSAHAKDLTQRLYSHNERLTHLLERLGFSVTRQGSSMVIQKIPRSERSSQNANDSDPSSSLRRSGTLNSRSAVVTSADLDLLNWVNCSDAETESARYEAYMSSLGSFDMDAFCEVVYRRVRDVEHMARKLQRDARAYRDKARTLQKEAHEKIAYKHFKEGDLALFLPTRNQTTGAWAAFNVGFPHYFLREQEAHRLRSREWLVARISRIQERVVDLSKSLQNPPGTVRKGGGAESESLNDDDNDNPFDLSDGLRWYLIDAAEDKPGAPATPGLAKSTVAANNVEAMAERHTHGRVGPTGAAGTGSRGGVASGIEGVSKTLSKSLESRRSSTGSKKALPFAIGVSRGRDSAVASETNSLRAAATDTPGTTSPTRQHTTARGASQRDPAQASGYADEATRTSGGSGRPADVKPVQPPTQANSEVGNDMDSMMGP
jgi:autophagy-related protein 11